MRVSIIIPSYNQPDFIEETFKNLENLKIEFKKIDVELEILLFDSCSGEKVQEIIMKYKQLFDYIEIKKDNGQYDAINNGIQRITGDYWTWLNTDDLIEISGCIKIMEILKSNAKIDYIYGNTLIIDDKGNCIKKYVVATLTLNSLLNNSTTIVQPGSFFRTEFTKKIGVLKPYECCFDYEYILRAFKNNCKGYNVNETLSHFRLYSNSKSGTLNLKFINEQLIISEYYKRSFFSILTYQLYKSKFRVLLKNTLLRNKKRKNTILLI